MSPFDKFMEKFDRNPGASDEAIRSAEAALGIIFPEDYAAFLRAANGGEGPIGEGYAAFYPVEELVDLNRDYQIDEYVPGLLLFGSSRGGEAFTFDKRTTPWPVVMVPFVGLSFEDAIVRGVSFTEFLQHLYDGGEW
jgi:hypothetical protein